jgi:hypothetical protein
MRHFLDQVRAFTRVRLQEDLADATAKFYRALRGKVEERLAELEYCRTRVDVLVAAMESPLAHLPVSEDTPIGACPRRSCSRPCTRRTRCTWCSRPATRTWTGRPGGW